MAKFVIAGKANCPLFAKSEILGDFLQTNLPNFTVHKWPIESDNWDNWLNEICEKNKWTLKKRTSPLIWRELIDRGGKGLVVGGADDFQEYAQCYYGSLLDNFMSDSSSLFKRIADENYERYKYDLEEKELIEQNLSPYNLCISGADHPSVYYLFPDILSSKVFTNKDLFIRLTTNDSKKQCLLEGLAMEVQDLACDQFSVIQVYSSDQQKSLTTKQQFNSIERTTSADGTDNAFSGADFVLLMDDYFYDQKQAHYNTLVKETLQLKKKFDDEGLFEDERQQFQPYDMKKDWNSAYDYYVRLAEKLDAVVKPTCKILIGCQESIMIATQAFINTVQNVQKKNVVGLARAIENQAKARVGKRLNVDISSIIDLHIIGDLNGDYVIDTGRCQISEYDGAIWAKSFVRDSVELIADAKWIRENLRKSVENRLPSKKPV
ncbi:unnamed protein product [Didymodactylos carnosus]|uniref:Uncharacterized protein n=1 Tax=Didymodactylos carnosus TaxID=1234261 RepID=A0A815XBN3_9BILA|nr:unnamed protein product [Didymodactylos carnosus]CAF4416657.1 unnamed protein product [Didymodactylos carnosus]